MVTHVQCSIVPGRPPFEASLCCYSERPLTRNRGSTLSRFKHSRNFYSKILALSKLFHFLSKKLTTETSSSHIYVISTDRRPIGFPLPHPNNEFGQISRRELTGIWGPAPMATPRRRHHNALYSISQLLTKSNQIHANHSHVKPKKSVN